jgi:hypothetical protein
MKSLLRLLILALLVFAGFSAFSISTTGVVAVGPGGGVGKPLPCGPGGTCTN